MYLCCKCGGKLSLVPFNGPKKSRGPSKSLDFVPGPFRILEMVPFSDFQGLISQCPATFTAQFNLIANVPLL